MDRNWLETCLTAGEFLYGEFPVEVLQKLYATKGERVTVPEIMEVCDESSMMVCDGKMFSPRIVTEGPLFSVFKEADEAGNPYASLHFDLIELEELRSGHEITASVDYWLPSASQIEELVEKGYISTPAMDRLIAEIKRRGGEYEWLGYIWGRWSTNKMDHIEVLQESMKLTFPEKDEHKDETGGSDAKGIHPTFEDLKALSGCLRDFLNRVNIRDRKGWPPEELHKKEHPHGLTHMPTIVPGSAHAANLFKEIEPQMKSMGLNVDYSSIENIPVVGQYGERKVVKVGRNDPCPCGSGKKYKRCHGR